MDDCGTGMDAAGLRKQLLEWNGGGPLVWINLTSDPRPRPNLKLGQDAQFQYIQGFVPPTADTWKAYDVDRPNQPVKSTLPKMEG